MICVLWNNQGGGLINYWSNTGVVKKLTLKKTLVLLGEPCLFFPFAATLENDFFG